MQAYSEFVQSIKAFTYRRLVGEEDGWLAGLLLIGALGDGLAAGPGCGGLASRQRHEHCCAIE